MNLFFKKIGIRIGLLLLLVVVISFINNEKKLWSVPDHTDFKKIPWINHQLDLNNLDTNSIVFLGPSLCENGINDSAMSINHVEGNIYNYGIYHACHVATYEVLKRVLSKGRPRMVVLWQEHRKAQGLHPMYPLIASPPDLQLAGLTFNPYFISSVIKRYAWNLSFLFPVNAVKKGNTSIVNQPWGYIPLMDTLRQDQARAFNTVQLKHLQEDIYLNNEIGTGITSKSIWRKMYGYYMQIETNQHVQEEYFFKCITLCNELKVTYRVLYYPQFAEVIPGEGRALPGIIMKYYDHAFGQKIHWLQIPPDSLNNRYFYNDPLHFNRNGAYVFSLQVLKALN